MPIALRILPGLDGTGRLSAAFLEALRMQGVDDASAIGYPVDRCLNHAALADHARGLLPADRPFALLAESFSWPIGLAIAADSPPGLCALILSTTFARAPLPGCAPLAPLLRFAPVHSAPDALLSALLLGRWSTPALRDALRDTLRQVDADVLRDRAARSLRVDHRAYLARIRTPTLVLEARHDRLLSAASSAALAAGIGTAHHVRIDGPHLLLQTRADACALEVATFIAGLRTGVARP